MEYIISTKRLGLRKILMEDFEEICTILQDIEIMYAWEHAFSNQEVTQWIEQNLTRYANEGYSYFAAIEKATGKIIGLMGPLIEDVDGDKQIGIAYILHKNYWGKGYAFEGAAACLQYAFEVINAEKVIAEIRHNNTSSRHLAEKLGMKIEGEFVKKYKGTDMPHLIYSCKKQLSKND